MRTWIFLCLLGLSPALGACGSDDGDDDTVIIDDTDASDTGDTTETSDSTAEDSSVEDSSVEDSSANDTGDEPDTMAAECAIPCDCAQGQTCTEGRCVLGATPVYCCDSDGCPADALCLDGDGADSLCGATASGAAGVIAFNEVLTDGEVSGDPNGDGDPSDAVGDEFVELVNAGSAPVVLDGFTLEETTFAGLPRHTFTAGTTIGPGNALVVFGGGSAPDDIPGTHFEVANAADPGISFGLSLDDDGDTLALRDASGALVAVFAWGSDRRSAISDRAYTRSPDITGVFVPHDEAQTDVLFSPGTLLDGTNF
ncbi:MAG: hypothetical protein ACI9MR_002580 [Myxococcota bacterium]